MTRGDIGGKPDMRQKEQERSGKILDAKLYWGRFSDTQIPLQKETINTIEFFIKKIQPDIIFTPITMTLTRTTGLFPRPR